jgi:hypothetical protein
MTDFDHWVFLTWDQAGLDKDRKSPGMWASEQFGPKGSGWIVHDDRDSRGLFYLFTQPEHAFAFKMRFG